MDVTQQLQKVSHVSDRWWDGFGPALGFAARFALVLQFLTTPSQRSCEAMVRNTAKGRAKTKNHVNDMKKVTGVVESGLGSV